MKVIVLEDDRLVADGLVRGLGYLGCRAFHALDVTEATALVGGDGAIRLALVDIGLAHGESGETFFAWLKSEHPEICRVLISGLGPPAGFVDDPPRQLFMRKPFGQAELIRLIQLVRKGGRP